jgi:hypothetical protein
MEKFRFRIEIGPPGCSQEELTSDTERSRGMMNWIQKSTTHASMHLNNSSSSFVFALINVVKTKSALKARLNSMNHFRTISSTIVLDVPSHMSTSAVMPTDPALKALLCSMNTLQNISCAFVLEDASNQCPGTRLHPQYRQF